MWRNIQRHSPIIRDLYTKITLHSFCWQNMNVGKYQVLVTMLAYGKLMHVREYWLWGIRLLSKCIHYLSITSTEGKYFFIPLELAMWLNIDLQQASLSPSLLLGFKLRHMTCFSQLYTNKNDLNTSLKCVRWLGLIPCSSAIAMRRPCHS